ncbi:MAG: hypothetical protein ACOZNI_31195 [Myxococcota bacterium]
MPSALKPAWLAILAVPALWWGTRHLGPPTREALSMIVVDDDAAAIVARLSVTNTSVLDRQLHTRLTMVSPGYQPLQHHALRGPSEIGPDGVAQEPDALARVGDRWELRIGGGALGARVTLEGADTSCPPSPGRARGFVQPTGDSNAGRTVDGRGVLARTRSSWDEASTAIYVLGPGFAAGVDPIADCPAWVRAEGGAWAGEPPEVVAEAGRQLVLGDWTITLRSLGEAATEAPLGHLLGPERALARLFRMAPARVEIRRVGVVVAGPGIAAPRAGVLVARR